MGLGETLIRVNRESAAVKPDTVWRSRPGIRVRGPSARRFDHRRAPVWKSSGPRLVLSHAKRSRGRSLLPLLVAARRRFRPDRLRLRNHGWNRVGVQQNHNIPILMHDHDLVLESVADRYGDKPTVGVFHSVSAADFAAVVFQALLGAGPLRSAALQADRERGGIRRRRRAAGGVCPAARGSVRYGKGVRGVPGLHAGLRARLARRARARGERHASTIADGKGFELRCPREYEAQLIGVCQELLAAVGPGEPSVPDEGHRGRSHLAGHLPAGVRP